MVKSTIPGNQKTTINYIIINMSSMISGPCMGSGNNPENSSSRQIFCQTTINIVMYSQTEIY